MAKEVITIEYIKKPIPVLTNSYDQYVQKLLDNLIEHADITRGLTKDTLSSFLYVLKDKNDQILGGVNGYFYYGGCYIKYLWIDKSLRKQGYGTQLMQHIEEQARQQKSAFIHLSTHDWEAQGFYEKLGYQIEFIRQGYAKNSSLTYLIKKF